MWVLSHQHIRSVIIKASFGKVKKSVGGYMDLDIRLSKEKHCNWEHTYDSSGLVIGRRGRRREPPDRLPAQKFDLGHFGGDPTGNVRYRTDDHEAYGQHNVLERNYQQYRLGGRHLRKHSLHLPAEANQRAVHQYRHQSHCLHRILRETHASFCLSVE